MSKKMKFVLLLLLSLTSVFFAEVISGSMRYPLYDLWGWFIVIPLYGLHTIVLLYIITRYTDNKKVLFSTLFIAGVLFGLYEAYLTKVLWVGLNDDPVLLLNISLIDFLVLVFFWHPILSFIIPSLVFEGFMTNSNNLYQGLPDKFKSLISNKRNRIILFVIIGTFLAVNSPTPWIALLSGFSTAIPILILYHLLRKKEVHLKYSLNDILPTKKGFIICVAILSLMYLLMGLFIYGDELTLNRQISIWVLYIFFGTIFYIKLKHNSKEEINTLAKQTLSFRYMIHYSIVIIMVGAILVILLWLLGTHLIFVVTIFLTWAIVGIILLVYSLLH